MLRVLMALLIEARSQSAQPMEVYMAKFKPMRRRNLIMMGRNEGIRKTGRRAAGAGFF